MATRSVKPLKVDRVVGRTKSRYSVVKCVPVVRLNSEALALANVTLVTCAVVSNEPRNNVSVAGGEGSGE